MAVSICGFRTTLFRLLILLVLGAFWVLIAPWYYYGNPSTAGAGRTPEADLTTVDADRTTTLQDGTSGMCEHFPDTGNIALSVKTGATSAIGNVLHMLNTTLACVKEVMVFSDLEQSIGELQVHDVLKKLPFEASYDNADFDLYREQTKLVEDGRESEIHKLQSWLAPPRDWRTKGKPAGWGLDKYKFLPMLIKAWEIHPEREWYVFIEDDTYLSWPNLNRWLATLDSKEELYLGRALAKSDYREPLNFAHGGSGFVLSGLALKKLMVKHEDFMDQIAPDMRKWWAGDIMTADILYDEIGLKVSNATPMFSTLDVRSVPLLDETWCRPIITVHHMDKVDQRALYLHEQALNGGTLLYSDVYSLAYPDGLPTYRSDWDNLSQSPEFIVSPDEAIFDSAANTDFETCKATCYAAKSCVQLLFLSTTVAKENKKPQGMYSCYMSRAFRIGQPRKAQLFDNSNEYGTARSWDSGWLVEKIEQFVSQQTCTEDAIDFT